MRVRVYCGRAGDRRFDERPQARRRTPISNSFSIF
jgi:hypothetical protein